MLRSHLQILKTICSNVLIPSVLERCWLANNMQKTSAYNIKFFDGKQAVYPEVVTLGNRQLQRRLVDPNL